MSRITTPITYNLHDRGRQHTGQSRANAPIKAIIDNINSPATQEMVRNGDIIGYVGHQLRAKYGMDVPETIVIGDRTFHPEPAVRTHAIEAQLDGTVTHQQEFLETESGEHAFKLYKAKVGGFSSAISLNPAVQYHGMDVVHQPNYASNTGNGQFDSLMLILDSANQPGDVPEAVLDAEIVHLFDSIGHGLMTDMLKGTIEDQQAQIAEMTERLREKRKREYQEQIADNLLYPTERFDSAAADAFLRNSSPGSVANPPQAGQPNAAARTVRPLIPLGALTRWLG